MLDGLLRLTIFVKLARAMSVNCQTNSELAKERKIIRVQFQFRSACGEAVQLGFPTELAQLQERL